MKQDQALIQLKEQARFYISTPERAAEALLFVRNLERFAEEVKAKVKERTIEVMDRENKDIITYSVTDQETGEIREWEVRRSFATETREYRPENVIAVLGNDAMKFLKVSKTGFDTFLRKAASKRLLTDAQIFEATRDPIIKTRKGAGVIMREIKPKV